MIPADDKNFIPDMTTGSIVKQLILFSLPLIGANLIQTFCQAAEMMIIGRGYGANGMSVLNICNVIYGFFTMSAVGFSFGGPILLARQSGAGEYAKLGNTIRDLFILAVSISAVTGLVGFIFRDYLLDLVHTPAQVYADAGIYLSVSCLTLLFFTVNTIIYSAFRGLGNSGLPMMLILLQTAMDIILNLIWIRLPGWGIKGAAFAMLISHIITCFTGTAIFLKKYGKLLKAEGDSKDKHSMCPSIISVSLPIILFGIIMSVSAVFINSNVNIYGPAASAADGIANQLKNIFSGVSTGIYEGATIMIAQSFGKEDFHRISLIFRKTILLGIIVCAVLTICVLSIPEQIFSLFTGDTEVISYAGKCLRIFSVSFAGVFLATGSFGLMEGVGNTKLESLCGIIENFAVKILLGYFLGKLMGLSGYWLGSAMASYVMPLAGLIYYRSGRWKRKL